MVVGSRRERHISGIAAREGAIGGAGERKQLFPRLKVFDEGEGRPPRIGQGHMNRPLRCSQQARADQ